MWGAEVFRHQAREAREVGERVEHLARRVRETREVRWRSAAAARFRAEAEAGARTLDGIASRCREAADEADHAATRLEGSGDGGARS